MSLLTLFGLEQTGNFSSSNLFRQTIMPIRLEHRVALVQHQQGQPSGSSHRTGRSRPAAFRDRDGSAFPGGATNAAFADGMMIDGRPCLEKRRQHA